MVGDFRYLPVVLDNAIFVEMQWDGTSRKAQLTIPSEVFSDMEENNVPVPQGTMSLEAAMSYAVFVAMSSGLPLYLAGDRSVWNDRWGSLILAM